MPAEPRKSALEEAADQMRRWFGAKADEVLDPEGEGARREARLARLASRLRGEGAGLTSSPLAAEMEQRGSLGQQAEAGAVSSSAEPAPAAPAPEPPAGVLPDVALEASERQANRERMQAEFERLRREHGEQVRGQLTQQGTPVPEPRQVVGQAETETLSTDERNTLAMAGRVRRSRFDANSASAVWGARELRRQIWEAAWLEERRERDELVAIIESHPPATLWTPPGPQAHRVAEMAVTPEARRRWAAKVRAAKRRLEELDNATARRNLEAEGRKVAVAADERGIEVVVPDT